MVFLSISVYGYLAYLPVILVVYILSLTVGKGNVPYDLLDVPLMMIGSRLGKTLRIPYWGLGVDTDKCMGCKRCNKACSMSLDIMTMVQSGESQHHDCIQCGACVDVCPKNAIELKVQ